MRKFLLHSWQQATTIARVSCICCLSAVLSLAGIEWAHAAEPLTPATQVGLAIKDAPPPEAEASSVFEIPTLGEATAYLPIENNIHLLIRLSKRRVYVYRGDTVITSYPIAIGKAGWETPVGQYQVFLMEKDPIFKSFKSGRTIPPGPDNPLGTRWIGIWTDGKTQLGFHGTNQPELIGQAVSHGCIRMHNKDVMALYEKVTVGTPVKVQP